MDEVQKLSDVRVKKYVFTNKINLAPYIAFAICGISFGVMIMKNADISGIEKLFERICNAVLQIGILETAIYTLIFPICISVFGVYSGFCAVPTPFPILLIAYGFISGIVLSVFFTLDKFLICAAYLIGVITCIIALALFFANAHGKRTLSIESGLRICEIALPKEVLNYVYSFLPYLFVLLAGKLISAAAIFSILKFL